MTQPIGIAVGYLQSEAGQRLIGSVMHQRIVGNMPEFARKALSGARKRRRKPSSKGDRSAAMQAKIASLRPKPSPKQPEPKRGAAAVPVDRAGRDSRWANGKAVATHEAGHLLVAKKLGIANDGALMHDNRNGTTYLHLSGVPGVKAAAAIVAGGVAQAMLYHGDSSNWRTYASASDLHNLHLAKVKSELPQAIELAVSILRKHRREFEAIKTQLLDDGKAT